MILCLVHICTCFFAFWHCYPYIFNTLMKNVFMLISLVFVGYSHVCWVHLLLMVRWNHMHVHNNKKMAFNYTEVLVYCSWLVQEMVYNASGQQAGQEWKFYFENHLFLFLNLVSTGATIGIPFKEQIRKSSTSVRNRFGKPEWVLNLKTASIEVYWIWTLVILPQPEGRRWNLEVVNHTHVTKFLAENSDDAEPSWLKPIVV